MLRSPGLRFHGVLEILKRCKVGTSWVGWFFVVSVTVDLYPARRITEAILPLTGLLLSYHRSAYEARRLLNVTASGDLHHFGESLKKSRRLASKL